MKWSILIWSAFLIFSAWNGHKSLIYNPGENKLESLNFLNSIKCAEKFDDNKEDFW